METESFACAICRRRICLRWNPRGRDRQIAPICRCCEATWSGARTAMDCAGTFRDRREVRRGLALANALLSDANIKIWEHRYASPRL